MLKGLKGPREIFLRGYCAYLAGEKQKEEERLEHAGLLGKGDAVNKVPTHSPSDMLILPKTKKPERPSNPWRNLYPSLQTQGQHTLPRVLGLSDKQGKLQSCSAQSAVHDGVCGIQELEVLERELHAATWDSLSADPFLLYLYGLVLSDRCSSGISAATGSLLPALLNLEGIGMH